MSPKNGVWHNECLEVCFLNVCLFRLWGAAVAWVECYDKRSRGRTEGCRALAGWLHRSVPLPPLQSVFTVLLFPAPPPPQVSVTDHKVQEFRASNNKERRYSERRPKRGQERNQSQARHTLLHHPRTPTTRPRFNRFTRARWRASKGAASATTMWKAAAPSLNLLICIRLSLTGSRGQGSPPARPPHRPGPSCSSDCEPHQCGCAPDRRTLLPSSGRGDT